MGFLRSLHRDDLEGREQHIRHPGLVRSDQDCRHLIATLEKPVYRGCFTLSYAYPAVQSESHATWPGVAGCRIAWEPQGDRANDPSVTYRKRLHDVADSPVVSVQPLYS